MVRTVCARGRSLFYVPELEGTLAGSTDQILVLLASRFEPFSRLATRAQSLQSPVAIRKNMGNRPSKLKQKGSFVE